MRKHSAPFVQANMATPVRWEPEELDIDDPLRGDPDSEDVVSILRSLHRPAADAFDDMWSGFADTDRFWR